MYQIELICVTGQHGRTVVLLNAFTLYKYIWNKHAIHAPLCIKWQQLLSMIKLFSPADGTEFGNRSNTVRARPLVWGQFPVNMIISVKWPCFDYHDNGLCNFGKYLRITMKKMCEARIYEDDIY